MMKLFWGRAICQYAIEELETLKCQTVFPRITIQKMILSNPRTLWTILSKRETWSLRFKWTKTTCYRLTKLILNTALLMPLFWSTVNNWLDSRSH
jgi:hypothetical protein